MKNPFRNNNKSVEPPSGVETNNSTESPPTTEETKQPVPAVEVKKKGRRLSFGSKTNKSVSSTSVVETNKSSSEEAATEETKPAPAEVKKKGPGRRLSFGAKTDGGDRPKKNGLGQSLRNLLTRRSSAGNLEEKTEASKTAAATTTKNEDGVAPAPSTTAVAPDMLEPNLSWEVGSATDTTSLTLTPPRNQVDKAMEDLENVKEDTATDDNNKVVEENKIDDENVAFEPFDSAQVANISEAQDFGSLLEMEETKEETKEEGEEDDDNPPPVRLSKSQKRRQRRKRNKQNKKNEANASKVQDDTPEEGEDNLEDVVGGEEIAEGIIFGEQTTSTKASEALEGNQEKVAEEKQPKANLEDMGKKIAEVIEEQTAEMNETSDGNQEKDPHANLENLGKKIAAVLEEQRKTEEGEKVPEPPSVPRNEDLLTLLNEANITTEVASDESVTVVEARKTQRIVDDEPELEVIEETDEGETAPAVPENVQQEKEAEVVHEPELEATETPSDAETETDKESIDVLEKVGEKDTIGWSPFHFVLFGTAALACLLVVLFLSVNTDNNLVEWNSVFDISALQKIISGEEEVVPEEKIVEKASYVIQNGCVGFYCGIY